MIMLRAATLDDARVLLEWRNDPSVYEHCFHSEPVNWLEHLQWLQRTLSDPHHHLLIVLNETGERIGQVRFDVEGETTEINVAIGQKYRGYGYGFSTITESSNNFLRQYPTVKRIIAHVKEENTPSIHIFSKAGYLLKEKKDGVLHFEFHQTNNVT